MTELSDGLLVAYVDGQLARRQSSAVEKVLEQDDIIARRVVALKDAHSRLEAAFEAILAGEELEVTAPEPLPAGFYVTWRMAMAVGLAGAGIAAAVLLALGGSGSLRAPEFAPRSSGVGDPPYTGSLTPSWQEEAARAQALLSRSTLEIGIDIQANRDLVAYQLAQTIGPGVKLPDLDAQGFRFVRAQLLRSESEPLAQILYLRATGAPLALYAKAGEGGETPVFKRYGTIGGATWSEGGVAYLLAGDADEADMMRLAGTIKSEPLPDATRDAGEAAGAASAAHPPLTEPPTVKAKP